MSGLVYDYKDNYDLSTKSTCSFRTEQIWTNQKNKNKFGKYKLNKD